MFDSWRKIPLNFRHVWWRKYGYIVQTVRCFGLWHHAVTLGRYQYFRTLFIHLYKILVNVQAVSSSTICFLISFEFLKCFPSWSLSLYWTFLLSCLKLFLESYFCSEKHAYNFIFYLLFGLCSSCFYLSVISDSFCWLSFDFFASLKVGLQFSILQLAVGSIALFLFCCPFEMCVCVCSDIWHSLFCCSMSAPSLIIVSISI